MEALIFENTYTHYRMESIRVGWEQLTRQALRLANVLENQILLRDSKGITKEQMDDFRKCFNYFDKNSSRQLDPTEFRSCLMSLGYSFREGAQVSSRFFALRFERM